MDMIAVISSNIAAVGYDPDKQRLRVQFRDGALWEYEQVAQALYEGLMSADSKNGYFRAHIRGKKPASRL